MAYNGTVFSGSLADINIALALAMGLLTTVTAQIDVSLFGSLGLGTLQANLAAQLSAALQASLDISLGIGNPLAGFAAALAGIAVLQATITLALAGGIPAVSLDIGVQLSALASFAATVGVQIAGLEAIIQALLHVKTAAGISFDLGGGPVFVISWEDIPMFSAGASINADFGTGLTSGSNTLLPYEVVSGVLLVTKVPHAWVGIKAIMLT